MKFLDTIARIVRNSDRMTELLSKLVEARVNQSTAVNARLDRLIEALDRLIEAQDDQACAVNERLDKVIELLRANTPDKLI